MWYSPAVAEHLPADVLADGGGSVQLEEHVGLQQVLGPVHLEVGDGGGHPLPLLLHLEEHVLDVQAAAHKVDAPQAGVLVASVERLEKQRNITFAFKEESLTKTKPVSSFDF